MTQGGCLPGSQTFSNAGTFTAPSGVTRIKIKGNGWPAKYASVSPGSSYSIGLKDLITDGDGESYWYAFSLYICPKSTGNITVSWSNSINQGGS